MSDTENSGAAEVAAVAVQIIGELSRMLDKGYPHDDDSAAMVIGSVSWLNSVIDGSGINPTAIGTDFETALKCVNESLLDEISRCQHYLQQKIDEAKAAEGRALANELYAGWYLRLRDRKSGSLAVVDLDSHPLDASPLDEDELDAEMEDLDNPTAAMPDPSEFA